MLFIFDRMNIIESELASAVWEENYIYKVFDGAWFNTKYNIENTWKEKNIVLLFSNDTLPQSESEMLKFPLLDMLKANMEYKEDDYASYIQQYGLPERYSPFIQRNITELMSAKISNILNGHISADTFSEDLACRAFISSYLGDKKLLGWEMIIDRMIILGAEPEEKKHLDFFNRILKNTDVTKCINEKLTRIFGVTYNPNSPFKMKEVAECLKYNSITQLLDVCNEDNYKKYKVINASAIDMMNKIYDTGMNDRTISEKFITAMKKLAADIKESEIISLYGIDAQYFHMTDALCWPILKVLVNNELASDPSKVNERVRELILKMPIQSNLQKVFKFIEQIALYYETIKTIGGTLRLNTPEDYVQLYLESFHKVDLCYRRTIEAYYEACSIDHPLVHELPFAKKTLDNDYANLVNVLNLEWLNCVKEKNNFFNDISLKKQEDFYRNEVDTTVKQAIIISDALRYEVAVELMEELAKEKHIAELIPYRAMLPTETKFCKPSLLPHQKLELSGAEMMVDGVALNTITDRSNHVNKYKEDGICIKYEDILTADRDTQREIFKRPLVYIFHDTIDKASHSQSPFDVIKATKQAVEELAILIKRLHATLNVNNVILTSDHGFIYNDMQFQDKDKHSIKETAIDKKTRYYLTSSEDQIDGIIKFPLDKVSGIQTSLPVYIGVPEGSNRLAAPGGYNFAHGGATLQEMIIPVIHSKLRKTEKTEKVGVALLSTNLSMVSSRLKVTVIQSEAVSMTKKERRIVCCVYNGDEPVTEEKRVTLCSTDATNVNKRLYELSFTLNKPVTASLLQFVIYDEDDMLNKLIKENVKNNTMIEQDF